VDVLSPTEKRRGCFCATPFRSHIAFSGGGDFLLGLSCLNLLVVLIHSVIPFLKFCVGQKVYIGFCHDATSLVHRVNNGWIYSRIASSLQ
jgi:hypothetical protein